MSGIREALNWTLEVTKLVDAAAGSVRSSQWCHASLLAMVGELRIELTTMRALHEAMRGRLAALERRSLWLATR